MRYTDFKNLFKEIVAKLDSSRGEKIDAVILRVVQATLLPSHPALLISLEACCYKPDRVDECSKEAYWAMYPLYLRIWYLLLEVFLFLKDLRIDEDPVLPQPRNRND